MYPELKEDYNNLIKKPMDITLLTKNLNENIYFTFSEFVKDAKLMCQNCQKYNMPKSPIYNRGCRLMKLIIKTETKLNKKNARKEVKRKSKIIVDDDENSIQENKITHQEDVAKTIPQQEKKVEVHSFLGKKRKFSFCDEEIDNSKPIQRKEEEVNADTEKKEPKGKKKEISDYNRANKKRKIDKTLTGKTNINSSQKKKKEEVKTEKTEETAVEKGKESTKEKPTQDDIEMKDTSQTKTEIKENSSTKIDIIPVVISESKEEKKEQQPSKLEVETKRASEECKEPNTISPIVIKDTQPEEPKKIEIKQLKAELSKLFLELTEDDLIKVLGYIARKCPLSCEDLPDNTMAVHFDKCDYECIEKAVILGKGLMDCTKVFSSLPPSNSPEKEKKAMAK